MKREDWISTIKLSSIPLRQLDENLSPIGSASGCLIDYGGKRLILTVSHATGDNGNWAIETKFIPGKGTELYQIGSMNFLRQGDISTGQFNEIDFAYATVPDQLTSYYQEIEAGVVKVETARLVFQIDFDLVPNSSNKYGVSGQTHLSKANSYLAGELSIALDLKYERLQEEYYIFRLPSQHPGHEYFKGCSGAPIIDDKGNVVALICSGNTEENTIYGISLRKYKTPLNIETGNLV